MIKRLNKYPLGSIKVAILGFLLLILTYLQLKTTANTPLCVKLIVTIMFWSVWSFMAIVSDKIDKDK